LLEFTINKYSCLAGCDIVHCKMLGRARLAVSLFRQPGPWRIEDGTKYPALVTSRAE